MKSYIRHSHEKLSESTAVTRNEEDDTCNEKIETTSMKNDDSLPQKNVPHHDDRFIHRCQVRLCEDNQLYMLPSSYLINIRRFYIFLTHSLMLDSREKGKRKCEFFSCFFMDKFLDSVSAYILKLFFLPLISFCFTYRQ